jgi:hypothetical protein
MADEPVYELRRGKESRLVEFDAPGDCRIKQGGVLDCQKTALNQSESLLVQLRIERSRALYQAERR